MKLRQTNFFDDEIKQDAEIKRSGKKFDATESLRKKEEAVAAAARSAWVQDFEDAVRRVAKTQDQFTTDDVLKRFPHLESCPEKRVLGAVMARLHRDGEIEPLGYGSSDRVESHGRPKRIWRRKEKE